MTAPEPSCPSCGEPVGERDRYCESCGAELALARGGTAANRAAFGATTAHACPRCGEVATDADRDDDWGTEYCGNCGTRRPDGADRVEFAAGPLALVSDRGLVHTRNEDAGAAAVLLPAPGREVGAVLAAVVACDGVSSVRRPEAASAAAVEASLDVLVAALIEGTDAHAAMLEGTARAVDAVAAVGADGNPDPPACTYVAALVRADTSGARITVGWLGDSRAYWLDSGDRAQLLTADDSWAGEMVRAGLLDEEAAMADPRAHSITKWLGADTAHEQAMVTPHVIELTPPGPGVLLVCTDGLWNYLPEAAGLSAVVAGSDPAAAATELAARALAAGGHDNITVAVLAVP